MDRDQASIEPGAATGEGESQTHPYGYSSLGSSELGRVRRS